MAKLDLSSTDLFNANLSRANLSFVNLSKANVSNTVLQNAPLPANDRTTDEKNYGIAEQSAERQLKRITKYTPYEKPIINQENEELLK